jgi:hypothetical protein
MRQLPLPLSVSDKLTDLAARCPRERRASKKGDRKSSEEKVVLPLFVPAACPPPVPVLAKGPVVLPASRSRPTAQPPAWPAALTWDDALTYTSLSEAELRRSERHGLIRFKCVGPRRSRVAPRDQLDRLISIIFGAPTVGVEEDFDFG